ncbi:RNA-binding S4 domain-containing protein [Novosphingobium lentum]|uniref:RNA-binding S4 domain-containing protein n=1 Tax=Novosphingobium lentum TaxID=145287 RepID=UPI00082D572C|nr:S4 domain-containing protein [Novosphingobium lentum]
MRIDRLLWFLRLARTRSIAQQWAAAGHIRLNGRRIERAAQTVAMGDVMVIPIGASVRVIELLAIPARRGPPAEAQACYRRLDETLDDLAASPLAPGQTDQPEGPSLP